MPINVTAYVILDARSAVQASGGDGQPAVITGDSLLLSLCGVTRNTIELDSGIFQNDTNNKGFNCGR